MNMYYKRHKKILEEKVGLKALETKEEPSWALHTHFKTKLFNDIRLFLDDGVVTMRKDHPDLDIDEEIRGYMTYWPEGYNNRGVSDTLFLCLC